MREAISWFRARSVTNLTWWLAPTVARQDWDNLLRTHGFHFSDGPPSMAADLRALNETGGTPQGLRIITVTDERALQAWVRTFIVGYEMPPDWEKPLLEMMTCLGPELPVRHYLGYLEDKPVATSNLFLSAGVAGLQFVATLPQARGRGLGGAMSLAALLEARQMGYRIGILQSSEMGFPVYRRLGFQHVCKVDHYYRTGRP